MLKLMNYLKPYWLSILAVLILLFVQANFDLALPDYMSRIVNEGIQQGGIDSPVPRVLSETSFIQLHRVLNNTESSLVVRVYRKVSRDQVRDVPLKLENTEKTNSNVYVLGPVSKDEQTELEQIIARSLSVITLMQKMPAGMGQNREAPSNSISEMDVSQMQKKAD